MSFYVSYDEDYCGDTRFEFTNNLLLAALLKDVGPQGEYDRTTVTIGYGDEGVFSWYPTDEALELLE
jgi:hypothetical protein